MPEGVLMKTVMYVCLGLALVAATVYFLMAAGVMHAADLTTAKDAPPGIVWVAGACYAVCGFIILRKKRTLWIAGAVINAIVIVFFFAKYATQPDVITSAPGLISKIAQIFLEAGLIYLIRKAGPNKSTTLI
jgi:hypothetical protein